MSRLVNAFLILSLCLSVTTLGLAAEDVSFIAKQVLPSTVLIQTYDANGNLIAQGSGFFISERGGIVTCYHVMRGYSSANVTTSDKKEYRVKNITAINKTNDLIKISLSTTEHNFSSLKLNTTPVEIGQEIIVVGEPLGLENTVSNGIVSAMRGNATQITAPVSPGSSGGPVVNMKGEVIGIVSAQMKFGQNLNFAIPASLISTMKPASTKQIKELLEPMPGVLPDDSKPIFN
jgi:serine protease Do